MEIEFPLQDVAITVTAVEVLEELADQSLQGEKPFFIGLGYHRPHLPFVFPEEFLNLYPTEGISLPSNRYVTENLPELAWSTYQEIRQYDDTSNEGLGLENLGDFNTTFPDAKTLELRRAYYASVSYIDREVGIVLRTLEGLGLAENTIVVLWGDHGWSLGENSEWSKKTNFEIANRIPFILRVPGVTDDGLTTDQLVESVDIFPTILEAAGFSAPPLCPEESGSIELCREGRSLLPLLQEQENTQDYRFHSLLLEQKYTQEYRFHSLLLEQKYTQWKKSVFWQFPRGEIWSTSVYKCMGYTILTALEDGRRMRYTVWAGTTPDGEHSWTPDWINLCDHDELYDLTDDPLETVNRYSDPEYADLKTSLYEKLRAGWRAEM